MAQKIRGLNDEHELDQRNLMRDTRSMGDKVGGMLANSSFFLVAMILLILLPFLFPSTAKVTIFIGLFLFSFRKRSTKEDHLPFRMPITYGDTDWNTRSPAGGYSKAEGVFFMGNEHDSEKELWARSTDVLTHILAFGTTGSGKTEFLVSLAFNAIAQGSGFFYIDPKAAPKLQAQIYISCRACGRDDDFRSINYLTRGKSDLPGGVTPIRTTNTTNPFTLGNAEGLANMLVSLIPKSEGGNAIFSQNAQSLMRALMYGLVELRDKGVLELSAGVIREYITLEKNLEMLEMDISGTAKTSLEAFLSSVGWTKGKPIDKQARSLNEQHGYARSYFGLALNNMTDTYGHIYGVSKGEVDMYDIVQNRRILVTLLPSLALAPEELKNLGVISLSAVKNAISIGLGSGQEGTFEDVIYSLPTDAPSPFLSITDEYAAIPTPGYIEVLTQGRGLGIAAIVASQDYAGITKADAEGAQQILENSKLKFALKMESASDTWEMFKKLAGDVTVMETGGSSINKDQMIPMSYSDDLNAKSVERCRINLRDLQEQIEGEFHAFFNGGIVRGSAFFANPPLPKEGQIRICQMIQVFMPDPKEIDARLGKLKDMTDLLIKRGREGNFLEHDGGSNDVAALIEPFSRPGISKMETAICSLMNWVEYNNSDEDEEEEVIPISHDEYEEETPLLEGLDELGLIGGDDDLTPPNGESSNKPSRGSTLSDQLVKATEWMRSTIVDDEFEMDMTAIHIAAGETELQARGKASKMVKDIQDNITYPKPPKPDHANKKEKNELTTALSNLLDNIKDKSED